MQRANKYQKKKRYNIKSKFTKLYAKRSLAKRSGLTNNVTRLRCEFVIYIRSTDSHGYILNANSNNFNNLGTEIPGTHSWTNLYNLYLRYKIYGMGVRVTPTADHNDIADGIANVPINVVFYPTYQSVTVPAGEILAQDDAFRVEPYMTIPQTKYWNFPDNFYQNSTGNGLGIWASTSTVTSQPGQISFACHQPFTNFSQSKTLYMARVMLYILLDGRKT